MPEAQIKNIRMKNILLICGLLLAGPAFSQTSGALTEAAPESVSMSSERLQRIDHVMNEYIDNKKMAGIAALVARNGKIVYYKALGYDDRENNKLLKRDDIFRIASQTKAITSVAVMILYEEGKITLDEPVSKYIHSFKNPRVLDQYNAADTTYTTVPAKREITIRDLLTHTSGIGYAQVGTPVFTAIYHKNNITAGLGALHKSAAEDIQRLGSLPLMHHPGENWNYGLNTDVLGYLVEVVSGMSLDSFFHKRIFEPLGMKDTYFYLPPEKYNRLANVQILDTVSGTLKKFAGEPGKLLAFGTGFVDINWPKTKGTYLSGGGGLSSTLLDYAIFLQMLLNGGEYNGKRILSRNSVRMMTTNQIGDLFIDSIDDRGFKFGLGFKLVTEKISGLSPQRAGTFSWSGVVGTTYWVDPVEKLIVLFYKQIRGADPSKDVRERLAPLVYQAMTD